MITFVITFNMITWSGFKGIVLEDIPLFSSSVIGGIISSFTEEGDEEMGTLEKIGKNKLYNPVDGTVSITDFENKIESRKQQGQTSCRKQKIWKIVSHFKETSFCYMWRDQRCVAIFFRRWG